MRRRRIPFSDRELLFVEQRKCTPRRALHAEFVAAFGRTDVTVDHLKSLCTRRGWLAGRRPWTADDHAQLRALYPHMKTSTVARRLGRTLESIYGRANMFGLAKSAEYLASPDACRLRRGDNVGAPHRFAKGHVPANKGKRMPFHPNSAATRFKKGQRCHNEKWAGHERVDKDGYVLISVNERNPHTGFERRYVMKHKWLWEQLHGPVPNGMALKCLDGNKQNTDPSNWKCVSRGLLPRLNGIHSRHYDDAAAELKPAILAIATLEQVAMEKSGRRTPRARRYRPGERTCLACLTVVTGRAKKCASCKVNGVRYARSA